MHYRRNVLDKFPKAIDSLLPTTNTIVDEGGSRSASPSRRKKSRRWYYWFVPIDNFCHCHCDWNYWKIICDIYNKIVVKMPKRHPHQRRDGSGFQGKTFKVIMITLCAAMGLLPSLQDKKFHKVLYKVSQDYLPLSTQPVEPPNDTNNKKQEQDKIEETISQSTPSDSNNNDNNNSNQPQQATLKPGRVQVSADLNPRQRFAPPMPAAEGGGVFFCGYVYERVGEELFPDYMQRYRGGLDMNSHDALRQKSIKRTPQKNDILMVGMHGNCQVPIKNFPGKVLFVNGEPNGNPAFKTLKLEGRSKVGQDVYQIGLLPDTPHSVLMYHGAWNLILMDPSLWPTLWDHSRKPKNSGKYKGLMYMSRKCHAHRENAVNRISSIMMVYHGSACKGKAASDPQNPSFQKMPRLPPGGHWTLNREVYSEYKFCMAMENSQVSHYISEKIVIAFLAGCIPVYFGSTEVFNVFNKNAFVFYDPNNPEPALQQLNLLHRNDTAYQEMLDQQPILANGETTVREYFSVSDKIGGGYLKRKLRTTMGLPD